MQRRTLVFLALVAAVGFLSLADASIRISRPSDLAERVTESCNASCVNSCNATWGELSGFLRKMSNSDGKKCDVCRMAYYAQDLNVDVEDCPCKTLESFRKLAIDEKIVPDSACAGCCLDWAMDAITFEEDCKDPEQFAPRRSREDRGSYRNACGFTIKVDEGRSKKEEEEKKDSKKSSDKKDSSSSSSKKKVEDVDEVLGVYDYESLGSQFDTCKCICRGLAPCKAPKDGEEEEARDSASTIASLFNSAAFTTAAAEDVLASILP